MCPHNVRAKDISVLLERKKLSMTSFSEQVLLVRHCTVSESKWFGLTTEGQLFGRAERCVSTVIGDGFVFFSSVNDY